MGYRINNMNHKYRIWNEEIEYRTGNIDDICLSHTHHIFVEVANMSSSN